MHKLLIEDDEGRTTVVPLVRDELTIGRKEGNAIRLTERNVSRRHARLLKQNGVVIIEDLASYTGVRVNGVRIGNATPVRDGDQVEIGDYKLSVKTEGAAEAAPAAAPSPASTIHASGGVAALVSAAAAAVPNATAPVATTPLGAGAPAPELRAAPAPALAAVPVPAAAVVNAASDAAPTIPLKTLVEQGRMPAQPSRLVVVTSSLGGMEFRLDRPSLVIGRTDENDIILNHPSISRHHAKVVRDGDRYTIVDLQSANGVRVAGETYDRVDVEAGDVVELGHVKLRFVGPWETWTYDPREFLPKSRRALKIGAAVGGIALAGVLLLAVKGRHGEVPPAPPVAAAEPAAVAAGPQPGELLAEAQTAIDGEDWDKATTSLDLLLSRPSSDVAAEPLRGRATELKRKVELERHGAETFAAFQQAATAKEPDVALSRFDEIPAASAYKVRAEKALGEIKTLFLEAHLDLADAARAQGRCDDVRGEVEKIEQVDPENRKAHDLLKTCKVRPARVVVAAAASPPAPRPPHSGGAARAPAARSAVAMNGADEFAPAPKSADPAAPPADPADLIRQAREAWLHQQCSSAIELSRRALKLKPGANDAHTIIAVCSCSTKDKDGAMKSYARLDERSRSMVRTVCARSGVELEE